MAMERYCDNDLNDFDSQEDIPETNLGIKLERRRRIEELFEQKRLQKELAEFESF